MYKSKHSRKTRAHVLNNGGFKMFQRGRKEIYYLMREGMTNPIFTDETTGEVYQAKDFIASSSNDNIIFDCSDRMSRSRKRKKKVIKNKIDYSFSLGHNLYHVVLTFTDYILKNTTMEERRQMVIKLLKSLGVNTFFIASIDFGHNRGESYIDDNGVKRILTGREHYHVIVNVPFNKSFWPYSDYFFIRKINNDEESTNKISGYIANVSMYAARYSEGNINMIYSRRKLSELPLIRGTSQMITTLTTIIKNALYSLSHTPITSNAVHESVFTPLRE